MKRKDNKDNEKCNCGKATIERGFNQCTECLDKAENEKYRHENE